MSRYLSVLRGRLQLTAVGEIYLRAVQPAFHQIAAATQRLQVPPDQKR
ncbi:LysR family transcriptional regulator [Klebsiella pneumoniae subsp. ozaenae]|uniref:LysR family transcriptional regulator n=1 Tax=Klebsiella pneumoniae subsp. ozaenae TaxID=574 RepID=A0A377ZIQ0_KLEPO|nr:LysR family transcriptional regulator [Klebsiella pneumoniae subsp. ozaenae]